jgi:hypothetical protein
MSALSVFTLLIVRIRPVFFVFPCLFLSFCGFANADKPPSRLVDKLVRGQSDSRHPRNSFKTTLFDHPLTIQGQFDAEFRARQDVDLDSGHEDNRIKSEVTPKLKILYEPRDDIAVYSEVKTSYERDLYAEKGIREEQGTTEIDQQWILFDHIADSNWSIQAGLQRIADKREWWWDEDLDAVRLRYRSDRFRFEGAIAEDIGLNLGGDKKPENDDIFRTFAHASYEWQPKQKVEGFFLHQNDHSITDAVGTRIETEQEDEKDAQLTWYGLRLRGKKRLAQAGKIRYWLDTAKVTGHERRSDYDDDPVNANRSIVTEVNSHKVSGWAMDVGLSWRTKFKALAKPRFTIGYAYGSGDSHLNDNKDHAFRPTGLEDNNGKFFGVNRFRYYGELLRPRLSNIGILTLASGYRLGKDKSLEIIYHNYRQVHASDSFAARVRPDPNGISNDIGEELDISVGLLGWQHLELEFTAAAFRAGKAFGDQRDIAYKMSLELTYNF